MRHKRTENRGRPSEKPAVIVKKFTREYDDSIWYYDLDKFANGPYLVEMTDTTYDKAEKLHWWCKRPIFQFDLSKNDRTPGTGIL